jgi:hypothetical protein
MNELVDQKLFLISGTLPEEIEGKNVEKGFSGHQ